MSQPFDLLTMGGLLAKATLILVGAMLIAALLRRRAAGARYVVWLAALAAVILFPGLVRWSPVRLEVLPATIRPSPIGEAVVPAASAPTSGPETPASEPAAAPARAAAPVVSASLGRPSLSSTLLALWAAAAAGLLAWLAFGAISVRRITRRGRVLSDPRWTTPLIEIADRLDVDQLPRLIASEEVEMPFACGVFNPTIVFPASAESWSDERRQVVLLHEMAHIRRRDLLGHSLGRIACALYWFHPLVWTAARKLRDESERACDDLVLSCGARPSDYAAHLLDVLTGIKRLGAPATALPMARKKEFEGRMLAILDPGVARGSAGRMQSAAVFTSIALIAVVVAAAAPAAPAATESPAAISAVAESPAEIQDRSTASLEPVRGEPPQASPQPSPDPEESPIVEAFEAETTKVAKRDRRRSSHEHDTTGVGARVATLANVLRSDPDEVVRRTAVWGIAHLHGSEATNQLVWALGNDRNAEVREMAAWGLAGRNAPSTREVLRTALIEDDDEAVRATSAWALGHDPHESVIPALTKALGDESTDVRRGAVWAMGNHHLESVPKDLLARLDDPDREVRLLVSWALGNHLDAETVPAVRAAFAREQDSEIRQGLFRALLSMNDQSMDVISVALKSEDAELRARAVQALAGRGAGVWPWPWPWPDPRPHP